MDNQKDQKEIVGKLKLLNSMIEDFLDAMDMDASEEDEEEKEEE